MSAFDRNPRVSSSRPPSVFSAQSIDTLVADQSYRGFPSEQAYLDALKAWADSKTYYETEEQLRGFYGTKTVENYLSQPGGFRTGKKENKDLRRATVAPQLDTVVEHNASTAALSRHSTNPIAAEEATTAATATTGENKGNKLKRVFSRRKTVV